MPDKIDIVVFGATGITGKHVIPYLAKFCKKEYRHLTWGIAGRSEKKLREILNYCEKKTDYVLQNVPILIADVQDEKSLQKMARQARVIINCCGPFRFFGEPMIKACVEEGTHHIDVSGEVQFIEEMQLKYHKKAEEKGVYIISACGFDSIPSDMGIVFAQQNFSGTLNSVETYLEVWEEGNPGSGSAINYGTWESLVYVIGLANELKKIRQKLFPKRLPSFQPKLKMKLLPRKTNIVEGWILPFRTTDRSVVLRTQRYFYERHSRRPIQMDSYFAVKSFLGVLLMIFGGLIILLMSKFSFGRKLLLKYPEKFTNGFVTHETPSIERADNGHFSMTFYGEGWKENLPDANHQYTSPPNRAITARVKGNNPAYGTTCICLALSAITIITETSKMPRSGGVYPPGYAFANTSLVKHLNANGVTFEILRETELK
ncbi:hypothetical protein Zmor_001892 [Zophobas morio]|uniref:Saccharopine dehydrogenase NADP binding domain-containing protein n=1 Tax=Zophobas morio TaxID=2755281 RepID=A0AA38J046_9CUCU|nr:hypothetical protein Zmor_001892 [Zophobas morio]